jgi:hypothetical protein
MTRLADIDFAENGKPRRPVLHQTPNLPSSKRATPAEQKHRF